MKVALICPANIKYMPYLKLYTNYFDQMGINYDIINWDRLGIEKENEYTFTDKTKSHKKVFFSYFKYSIFIAKTVEQQEYSRIVIFGLQLAYFLNYILLRRYRKKYILDIRDYNIIMKYANFKKIIERSYITFISSKSFLKWLPITESEIRLSHNLNIERLLLYKEEFEINDLSMKHKFNISYIGTIRDIELNTRLIIHLKGSEMINLTYSGSGDYNNRLDELVKENNIENVTLTGSYSYEDEPELYKQTDFVNILLPSDTLNSSTLLPNRLYNAVLFSKPIISMRNTYVGEIVEKYGIGIVLDSISDFEKKIIEYSVRFDYKEYEVNRKKFLDDVFKEQTEFTNKLETFLSSKMI